MNDERLRAVWKTELDRLEVDVVRVERLLDRLEALPMERWQPPIMAGQMPDDLAPRAQELLDRQERATAALRRAVVEAQRQLGYADRVSDAVGVGAARPVYLDLDA